MKRDYYEVLGLERNADDREIKRAYRRLAMQYHPDRNSSPEAEEKFKEASEAYEVLSASDKRQVYDRHGFDGLRSQGFSGAQGAGMEDIFSSFGDIFGDLFGFGGQQRRRGGGQRGADLRYEMTIEFVDAVKGCSRDISIEQHVACSACRGVGSEPGSQPERCPSCQGRGQVVHGQGLFLVSTPCVDCQGQGMRHAHPCHVCQGSGRSRTRRKHTVNLPAGFDDGMSLRYNGEGEPGSLGGPAGDLYITVQVRPHPHLRREEDDLIAEVDVPMVAAALGTEIEVETVEGTETLSIPAGTQPMDVITLKRRGVPRLRGGGRGNFHVVCRVVVPRSLSAAQRKLLEAFNDSLQQPKRRSLFS